MIFDIAHENKLKDIIKSAVRHVFEEEMMKLGYCSQPMCLMKNSGK